MGLGLGVSMQTLCQKLAACFFQEILAVGSVGSATMPCGWRMRDIAGPVPCDDGPGYAFAMKAAITLPDDVFGEAEGLAAQFRISRSELHGRALEEFLARHAPDQMAQALDTLCDSLDTRPDGFVARSGRRVWGPNDWSSSRARSRGLAGNPQRPNRA